MFTSTINRFGVITNGGGGGVEGRWPDFLLKHVGHINQIISKP